MTPLIETPRLWLTPATELDAQALYTIWAEPAVRKYLCDDQILPLEQIQKMLDQSVAAFQEHRYGIWIARLKPHKTPVGFTGYWPFFDPPEVQLIYGLASRYWKHGLATEMARTMLTYGFQSYGFDTISASANAANTASIAVMQRLGMTFQKQVTNAGQELVFYTLQQPVAQPS
ncbi:MAG: GNAT family N-acetyltransferase [Synechococcales cyanobacterium C42_A2020_086]|jgi:ribosomal-protein-alanine N-acetyltransferase|nr:GNAT family N-acetyltransferase [Synechococcales cyanobacterium C42_A2020_086]